MGTRPTRYHDCGDSLTQSRRRRTVDVGRYLASDQVRVRRFEAQRCGGNSGTSRARIGTAQPCRAVLRQGSPLMANIMHSRSQPRPVDGDYISSRAQDFSSILQTNASFGCRNLSNGHDCVKQRRKASFAVLWSSGSDRCNSQH